jgi:dCMP deaminase
MDKYGRPDWDSYFMALAFVASQRSIDPSTKHGCVLTTPGHKILSIGYNGPPRNADEARVPLTRPEKYPFMAHAEPNAIDNCVYDLEGCIAYVTGKPCSACLLRLIQRGVGTIIHGRVGSDMVDEADAYKSRVILESMKPGYAPKIIEYNGDEFADVLVGTLEYVITKCGSAPKKQGYVKRLWAKIWG